MKINATLPEKGRDLRLDLFRGVANWAIYLDHIPDNVVNWITTRNYGFSDAADLFVFISGYTASFVYARMMLDRGFIVGATRLTKRVWQLYVAHIILFVIYIASISYLALRFGDSELVNEFNVVGLIDNATETLRQGLFLKFKPVNLDVLPLYIVLLATFPFVLPAVVRWPFAVLGGSLALYAATCRYDWNLPAYPDDKVWFFNPMAWQVLFHMGAAFAVLGPRLAGLDRWRWPLSIAALLYLCFAAFIAMSWHYNSLERLIPEWVARQIFPIDKTNVDILRLLHFLALAWLVRVVVPQDAPFLRWRVLEPIRRCGEHSLQVFCLGTFLALTAQIVVNHYEDSVVSQIIVSIAGLAIMTLVAYAASWFKGGSVREARA